MLCTWWSFNKKLSYEILHKINNVSTIWEGRFIEITLNVLNKKIILGNIYRPPHDNYNQFITELTPIVCRLNKCKRGVFIGGDFNIDLIKINEKPIFNEYLDMITSCNFFHKITLPTRLTENGGTLIDNFICKLSHNFNKTTSGIIVSQISDHLPYFIPIDYNISI